MILIFIGFWVLGFWLNDGPRRVCSSALSRSTDAGIGVELDEDVVDRPGTTIGTWFSVVH